MHLEISGIRLRGNVWIGEGAEVDDVEGLDGPAYIGNNARIARDATVAPYTVLSNGVTLRERARTTRTVIDSSTHVGRSTVIEGAIVGRSCDIRDHVRIQEGAAIGDEVTIGSESSIMPHVRIYPYKEVETGSQVYENLIWESRASSRLFGKDGVEGLVNVDLTPETAVRLAAALGTALKRGARVVASRDSGGACRMIKRCLISGLNATGVNVADLRVSSPAVSRHVLKTQAFAAAIHVGTSHLDPEAVFIRIYEPPGILLTASLQKEIEKNFTRQEIRRVASDSVGTVSYPARVRESYAQDLLGQIDAEAVRERGFRLVVDYGYSAASFVLPLVVGPLGVEAISAHGFFAEESASRQTISQAIGNTKRLVTAIGADLGRGLRHGGRAALPRRRRRQGSPRRPDAPPVREAPRRPRRRGEDRIPGHGHEPGRRPRERQARGGADTALARRPDPGRRHGRRRLRRRRRRRLRLSRVPAGLRRRRLARQAAGAVGAGGPAALRARRRVARVHARPPPDRVPLGQEGARDADAERAARRAATST